MHCYVDHRATGLIGHIVSERPLGNFHYQKQLTKKERLCQVRVYSFWSRVQPANPTMPPDRPRRMSAAGVIM
jgi:hypothetical protein